MITEEDQKKYRIAIGGFRSQRKLSHIKISKLEQKKRKIDKEIEKVEKGLAKNKEMEAAWGGPGERVEMYGSGRSSFSGGGWMSLGEVARGRGMEVYGHRPYPRLAPHDVHGTCPMMSTVTGRCVWRVWWVLASIRMWESIGHAGSSD